jgi:hypothetical protein
VGLQLPPVLLERHPEIRVGRRSVELPVPAIEVTANRSEAILDPKLLKARGLASTNFSRPLQGAAPELLELRAACGEVVLVYPTRESGQILKQAVDFPDLGPRRGCDGARRNADRDERD